MKIVRKKRKKKRERKPSKGSQDIVRVKIFEKELTRRRFKESARFAARLGDLWEFAVVFVLGLFCVNAK